MKDASVIPQGPYCYDKNGTCPYWSINPDYPEQQNGYCAYLEQGDWGLEKDMTLVNIKTGETQRGNELPFPVSLLWDQCKECGINDDLGNYISKGKNSHETAH